jgi:hypothetical protein
MEREMSAVLNHAHLPVVADARLPATYEGAKVALSECSRIDECQAWADKAAALASYARQANDDSLLTLAKRIQGRAVRRAGELLKQVPPAQGARTDLPLRGGVPTKLTREHAAAEAGLSRDQRVTALRVASVDEADFEAAIESEHPPTITEIAEAGRTKRPITSLGGRSASQFNKAMHFVALVRRYADALSAQGLDAVEFLDDGERAEVRRHIARIDSIHDSIMTRV